MCVMKKIIFILLVTFCSTNLFALDGYVGAGLNAGKRNKTSSTIGKVAFNGFLGVNIIDSIALEAYTESFTKYAFYGVFKIKILGLVTPFVKLGLGYADYSGGDFTVSKKGLTKNLVLGAELNITEHHAVAIAYNYTNLSKSSSINVNDSDVLLTYKYTF